MSTTTNLVEIRRGDHVKQWFQDDDKAIRVDEVRTHHNGTVTIIGKRVSTGHVVAIPQTTSMVVVWRPMTGPELFECAQSITGMRPTGCLSCGATWQYYAGGDETWKLFHTPDCDYRRTLDEMPG